MNYPAIPLITVDPYFSVWSQYNFEEKAVNNVNTFHWTGSPNSIKAILEIDGVPYRFLGLGEEKALTQKSVEVTPLSTEIIYEGGGVSLKAVFTSPLIAIDLYLSSRPVSYLKLSVISVDGMEHKTRAVVSFSEEICLNKKGEGQVEFFDESQNNLKIIKMGNKTQNVLNRSGDDVRIDWGYFYLAAVGEGKVFSSQKDGMTWVNCQSDFTDNTLFLFAYDDIESIVYFKKNLKAFWKSKTPNIIDAIKEAAEDYNSLIEKCNDFSADLIKIATEKGGTHYAEILSLAYRQVMAGHKLVVDEKGNNLYISKECFSNGCAATVDVTYPSSPMYLYYNRELLKAMLRPIFKYAEGDNWQYDFAPHDVGQYPIVNGQVYADNQLEYQMPLEECGNMIILVSAICKRNNDFTFAKEHFDLLERWSQYLVKYGEDPKNQLCTDDFAGHLAHNCNLSIKAIMGIVGFSEILKALGEVEKGDELLNKAKFFAKSFLERAKNSDGSYRLSYDRAETFSLKYNAVWDKVWKIDIFPKEFYEGEISRYKKEALPYGVPLDSREKYTKSDWLMWCASLAENKDDFTFLSDLVYKAFDTTRDFVPMTDWYYADTAQMRAFRHRTVQGGLFIKFLID